MPCFWGQPQPISHNKTGTTANYHPQHHRASVSTASTAKIFRSRSQRVFSDSAARIAPRAAGGLPPGVEHVQVRQAAALCGHPSRIASSAPYTGQDTSHLSLSFAVSCHSAPLTIWYFLASSLATVYLRHPQRQDPWRADGRWPPL